MWFGDRDLRRELGARELETGTGGKKLSAGNWRGATGGKGTGDSQGGDRELGTENWEEGTWDRGDRELGTGNWGT